MKKRPVQKHLFHVLTLSLVILLAGGGIALLYQWHLGNTSSYASSDSVVGPPSLPASTVDSILRRVGSPMVGVGQAVEAASRAQNIDDAFGLAVWWTETNDGAAGVGLADRNPGSVRGSVGYPSAYDGYTIYPSYTAAITYWFSMMKRVYINRGLTTVGAIAHPYVGTSTSNLWAGKVINLMVRYRGEAPAPTPTPKPTLAPDIKRQGQQLSQEQQQQGQGKSTYYPPVPHITATTSTATVQGLSKDNQKALVLFALLLALVFGMWAWSVNKRYARRPQPALASQAAANQWEQIRANGQQPAALFSSFNTSLRTTDNLVPGLRTTESLATATSALPGYKSFDGQLTLGAYIASQVPFENSLTPPASSWADQAQPVPSFSSWLDQPQPASSWADQAQPVPSFSSWLDQPQLVPDGMDEHGSPFDKLKNNDTQPAVFQRPALAGLSRPAQGSLHRTRLRPTDEPLQPVGAGTGGGLLSRYRERQTWD